MLVAKDKNKFKFIVILLGYVLTILLVEFFLNNTETEGAWEWLFISIFFFFLLPLIVIKTILKAKPSDYFFEFHPKIPILIISGVSTAIFVATIWLFVVQFEWMNGIVASKWVLGSVGFFMFVDLAIAPLVVFAKEFFFRGFIFKSAIENYGLPIAIGLQALLALFAEAYLTGITAWQQLIWLFFLNFFLGLVAYLNQSIFVSAIVSWIIIISIDLLVVYKFMN